MADDAPVGGVPGGRRDLTRRALLALPLAWALAPIRSVQAAVETRQEGYDARVALLYGVLSFESTGTIEEALDPATGRYEVHIAGAGRVMTSQVKSTGVLREGRWAPTLTRSRFVVYGRESRLDVTYNHARRRITYHGRAETFFLRRWRVVDDVVPIPDATHVDDVISASLNYTEDRWPAEADGRLVTHVVRRQRSAREGPEDVERRYWAELVPFTLRVSTDPATGKASARFDLTRFSSWARADEPARIVFSSDRRPELISATLILGTSVTIRITR